LAVEGRVVVTGGPAERAMLEQLRSRLSPSARGEVLLVSDFSLPHLVAALSQLTTLTASSTGPLHVAGVLGTPVVGLFSPHPAHVPAKWAPLGHGHTLLVAPLHPGENPRVPREQGAALMARITVDQVVAANLKHARASAHSHQAA
jgi:ADP-heptose:LPS heptosyltransferase